MFFYKYGLQLSVDCIVAYNERTRIKIIFLTLMADWIHVFKI